MCVIYVVEQNVKVSSSDALFFSAWRVDNFKGLKWLVTSSVHHWHISPAHIITDII